VAADAEREANGSVREFGIVGDLVIPSHTFARRNLDLA
jgi:hypothetical protein